MTEADSRLSTVVEDGSKAGLPDEAPPLTDVEGARGGSGAVAVIVHWGEAQATVRLAQQHLRSGVFDRVAIVANDGTVTHPSDPRMTWIVPTRNLGFGSACQYAARLVDADRYAFLNTDVRLPGETARRCLSALDTPGVGITGPLLVREDDTFQSGSGSWMPLLGTPRMPQRVPKGLTLCAWVTGAAMFCRREVVTEVGFDGSYFLGSEDADLCDRVAEAGWKVAVVDARAYHEGGATMTGGRAQYYTLRNRIWFARKRRTRLAALVWTAWTALVLVPRIALADVVKRRGHQRSIAACRALTDAWAKLPTFGEPWPHEPVPQAWMRW